MRPFTQTEVLGLMMLKAWVIAGIFGPLLLAHSR